MARALCVLCAFAARPSGVVAEGGRLCNLRNLRLSAVPPTLRLSPYAAPYSSTASTNASMFSHGTSGSST